MKHVIALHASKRKMNTYGLLVEIQKELTRDDVQVEILSLFDHKIEDCIGCEKCIMQDACVWHDDMEYIMRKMEEADGIILSSPVYLQQVSGKIKNLIDRTCKWYHRPSLYGKPVLCAATTKGSGLKSTLSYLRDVAIQWGAMPAGVIGRTIRSINTPVQKKEIEGFVAHLRDPQNYRTPLYNLVNFEVKKALAKHLNGIDEKHWAERGWMTMPYYFACHNYRYKRLISGALGCILQRRMARGRVEPSDMI